MTTRWPVVQQLDPLHVRFQGDRYLYFGGCDYLRHSWHPKVRRAMEQGLKRWGLNVSASRSTTGNHPRYRDLELALAQAFGFRDAILTSSGYMAPMIVAQANANAFAHILCDEKTHGCMRDGAAFMHCPVTELPHAQPDALQHWKRRHRTRRPCLVMTDGLFSQDSRVAPVREWSRALGPSDWLLVDDAHGLGILGNHGRGTLEWTGTRHPRLILTATLSKALGAYGGVILGSPAMLERIRNASRMLVGNTPLPLPLVEASLQAVDLVRTGRQRRRRLSARVELFQGLLRQHGWNRLRDTPAPMVCLTPKTAAGARRAARSLRQAGIYPSLIHYPGAGDQGYFRFALCSEHRPEHIERLATALAPHLPSFLEPD